MTLGGEVDYRVHPVIAEQTPHQIAVSDIAPNEDVSTLAPQRGQGIRIAGVGQLVQIDDLDSRLSDEKMDEIGADEAGTTGHQNASHGD